MAAVSEQTTAFALHEKSKLIKSLRHFDMVFFTVCAFVGLDTLGTVASNGAQGFLWLVVLALVFVAPYMLVMAEVGSAFTMEGGPYEWVKLAFGRLHGCIAAVLYWVTNPLWVGGSLAFIATDSWRANVFDIGHGTFGDYLFKFIFIVISIGGIILVLPTEDVTGIGGFIDAVTKTFSVYGGAAHTLLVLMTICFVGTLVTSGAVWMIGSDRIQAVAAYDGAFFPWFGVFNRTFGTPVRVNMMSGIVSTIFCFAAIAFFNSGSDSTFQIVLDIAISTTLISYVWIFPAALKLRYTHPDVPRP